MKDNPRTKPLQIPVSLAHDRGAWTHFEVCEKPHWWLWINIEYKRVRLILGFVLFAVKNGIICMQIHHFCIFSCIRELMIANKEKLEILRPYFKSPFCLHSVSILIAPKWFCNVHRSKLAAYHVFKDLDLFLL